MTRLDRAFLDAATFPISYEVRIGAEHLDARGHVNNIGVATLLQEARFDFNRRSGIDLDADGLAMAALSLHMEFARDLHARDPVQILTGVKILSSRSYVMAQVVRQKAQSAAFAEMALAFLRDGRAVAIPEQTRSALQRGLLIGA